MSATNHTQNYELSQFVGGDIPSWLGDYNGDMSKIDTAIATVASGAGDIASEVNGLKSRMTTAEADIDVAEGNITQLQTTASSQGASISTNTNNIASLDTRVTALEQAGSGATVLSETLTAGQTTVTFTNSAIKTTSYVDVYTEGGIPYTGVTQTAGSVVVTFDAQSSNLSVSIVVRDFT